MAPPTTKSNNPLQTGFTLLIFFLRKLFQRLDIRDDIIDLFIGKSIVWHQLGFKTRHDLCLRRLDRFMKIGFISRDHAAIRQLNLGPKQTKPGRTNPAAPLIE